ncbi:T3SS effector HopA1 family protein [Chamaesiphon minutus]|uniref:Uncharacterized protein n=1 Tax=Chamaesiphon minutus (strain ATCC 27169 / PCC 6605) TaxID=1173020 RepID=K9UAG0_CHAP6|nr:T3SS effector HopA1 family protein [Chamaesiphon minutus]AFY91795.1 hypothetical protein Cha6605_0508 [Chamaesiphon minutus PCC 6605]
MVSNFQQVFVEIVNNIEIAPDLTISHPDYPPLTIDPDLYARFSQIPIPLQTKFLTDRVRNYLYNVYFTGSLPTIAATAAAAGLGSPITNNLINGVDIDFYRRLQQSNTSRGYFDINWRVVAETDDGELIISKDGLNLHVDRQHHLPPNFHNATIDDTIPIYLPHSLVGVNTYIMVGNAGSPQQRDLQADDDPLSVKVYFNFTPDAAVAIAQQLTSQLNQLGIAFEFAVLHDPAFFYRYDAATLWLSQANYLKAQPYLINIYQAHQSEFSPQVPLFTKQLAPGLAIAEVPLTTTDSFGRHRCELVARGLVSAELPTENSATASSLSEKHI